MEHVLIIGHDRAAATAVEDGLWAAGYRSLVHALDGKDAWAMLRCIRPSLIVLLSESAQGLRTDDLYRMSEMADAPILVATGDPAKALKALGGGASLEGPYAMDRLEHAVMASAAPAAGFSKAA